MRVERPHIASKPQKAPKVDDEQRRGAEDKDRHEVRVHGFCLLGGSNNGSALIIINLLIRHATAAVTLGKVRKEKTD